MITRSIPAIAAALGMALTACGEDEAATKSDPVAPKAASKQERTPRAPPRPEPSTPAASEEPHRQPVKRRPRALTRERVARAEQDKGKARELSARELKAIEREQKRGTAETQVLSERQLRAIELEQQRR